MSAGPWQNMNMGKLHPEAEKAYNAKAADVLNGVHSMPPRPMAGSSSHENSDVPIARHLGEGDIKLDSYREYRQDRSGIKVACYFYVDGRGLVGVADTSHATVVNLARRIAGDKAHRSTLSEEFVYNSIIKWLQTQIVSPSDTALVDHVEIEATAAVRTREIWVPFPVATIPQPLQIGSVLFRRITKPMMDEYAQKLKAYDTPRGAAVFDRLRTRLQSTTAACVTIEAEPIKAKQFAMAQTDEAIAMFRLACPILLDVYQWAPIDPAFVDATGGTTLLEIQNKSIAGLHTALPTTMYMHWVLSDVDCKHYMRLIWRFAHNLLVNKRNSFQDLLLEALIHFSKSVLKSDTSERLMYVITALEALFVRKNEPIVQNLSERLANMQRPNLEERLKTVETVTAVYDLRSEFVHRAVAVADMTLLADFFVQAWAAMFFVLNNYDKWSTKAHFLQFIDSFKFRGPELNTRNIAPVGAG
jgi:Apea-like HEPN